MFRLKFVSTQAGGEMVDVPIGGPAASFGIAQYCADVLSRVIRRAVWVYETAPGAAVTGRTVYQSFAHLDKVPIPTMGAYLASKNARAMRESA